MTIKKLLTQSLWRCSAQAVCMLAVLIAPSLAMGAPFKTLDFLKSIEGQYILSGQHNDQKDLDPWAGSGPTNQVYWTERVHQITGKYPALYGGDFLFHGDSNLRWDMVYEAERQWNRGAAISIMWHACPPTQGAVCQWDGGLLSSLASWQWDELLTHGSNLNNTWKARIDDIAVYLQYLEDKGVEVLWRPLHEQNQTRFWWNSRDGASTAALWRLTHDYMTHQKGLSNLIWVWDVQDIHADYAQYNPGANYFDMMALDVYADGLTNLSYYDSMLHQAGAKPVAIGECFHLPTEEQLRNQPRMTFFMNWAYGLKFDWEGNLTNSDEHIRQVYSNPRVLTLDEMPGWDNVAADNLAINRPVQVSSTEAGGNAGANAVDGHGDTRWSSEYSDPQWIAIDLGQTHTIERVRLQWETAFANAYQIQVSDDGSVWTGIYQTASGDGSIDDLQNLNGSGRYLRLLGTSRATEWGYSLWELEVYGTIAGSHAVELYQHCDYGGWAAGFNEGSHGTSSLLAAGGVDDDASSIKIQAGYEAVLYANGQFSGSSVTLNSDTSCLVGYGMNDIVSSLVVRKIGGSSSSSASSSSSTSSSSSSSSGSSTCNSPYYAAGATYSNGQRVQHVGSEFRCDVGGWCSQGGPYEPGVGWAWEYAWTWLASCH